MPRVEIEVTGQKKLARAIRRLTSSQRRHVVVALDASANDVRNRMVKLVRAPGHGRTYQRGVGNNLSRVHTASAPGEPPATDTGNLLSSIQVKPTEIAGFKMTAAVESRAPYAKFLEEGTGKMKPRPFGSVALREAKQGIIARIKKAFRRANDDA